MDTRSPIDEAVTEEFAGLRRSLYYSEKQRLKAGEYQLVASVVARRAKYLAVVVVLCVCGCVAMGAWQLAHAVRESSMSGMVIGVCWMLLAGGFGGAMVYYYVRIKTKLATIGRLLHYQNADRAQTAEAVSAA